MSAGVMRSRTNAVVIIVLGVVCLYFGFHAYRSHDVPLKDMSQIIPHEMKPQPHSQTHLPPQLPPEIYTNILKLKTETDKIIEEKKTEYGPIKFSGIRPVNTDLTLEEHEQFKECMENFAADRRRGYNGFWGSNETVRSIRTRNHTYLGREDAVLLEVGGNRGDDASLFVSLFNPRFIILEPIELYANILRKKFADNPRVTVVNIGLGQKDEIIMVDPHGNDGDATSMFDKQRGQTPLHIVNTTSFLLKLGVGLFDFDLMTLNCEGCEYLVLEEVLSSTLVNHFRNIQFATHSIIGVRQFHPRYCKIRTLLSRTHRPIYEFKVIWESWRRKDLK